MSRIAAFLERIPGSRGVHIGLIAFMGLLLAIGNWPWHLDNYDQAKQAYVAQEITKSGELWFQHTPQGRSASKPPLMGWISAGLKAAGIPWDIALRLPSILCALALLAILLQEGKTLLGVSGATLAAAAFGFNLMTPHLATLVRTDMMLSFFIFLIGWMIYRKLRSGVEWTTAERWGVFWCMMAALFAKGPVLYAFLLPGLIVFAIMERGRSHAKLVWPGWWPWLIPLGFFIWWGIAGLVTNRDFYNDVVVREFLSRFHEGARKDERPQPIWFYFPHLLHQFAPWSLLLLGIAICFPEVRRRIREKPHILWLVLWSVGGLLFMTIVPAKRVDRIYPVIPPFCLLLVEWCAMLWGDRRVRIAAGASLVAGVLFAGCYFIGLVPLGYHDRIDALVNFSQQVSRVAASHGVDHITLPRSRDEGLLFYFDRPAFDDKSEALEIWKAGKPCALVLSEGDAKQFFAKVGHPVEPVLDSGKLIGKNEREYYLFLQD